MALCTTYKLSHHRWNSISTCLRFWGSNRVEVEVEFLLIQYFNMDIDDDGLQANLILIEKLEMLYSLNQVAHQWKIAKLLYNSKVKAKSFLQGSLVHRRLEVTRKGKNHGKLDANREGLYMISKVLRLDIYQL